MKRLKPWVIVLFIAVLGPLPAWAGKPFRYPEGVHRTGERKGELKYVNGLPVLFVEGTPEQIGEQVGELAAKPAKRLLDYPRDMMKDLKADFAWPIVVKSGKNLLDKFPENHLKEMEAMAKTGVDRDHLIVGNTIFDVYKIFACSSLIIDGDRSATKGPLFGRNLDFPTLGYLQEYSLVMVVRPEGVKHSFVSIGFPGMVGVLSGMNDAGLSLAVHEVAESADGSKKFDPEGTPYALCHRRILEECSTVDEAIKLLKSMKRTTMTNLAICDKNDGGVIEVTPKSVAFRNCVDGCCVCTNHFHCEGVAPEKPKNIWNTLDRFETIIQSRNQDRYTVADIRKRLHAASFKEFTLQTMVFEPAAGKLHLSIGECPASARELKTLDVGKWLSESAARPRGGMADPPPPTPNQEKNLR